MFIDKDPDITEKSDIYKKFEEGKDVLVVIVAVLVIKDRILTGICFPEIEIDNEYPHMTMMYRQCESQDSNEAL